MNPGEIINIEPEFKEWPKIHRFNRPVLVTEKIDGTNGLIWISDDLSIIKAGSRTRWIKPGDDNFGFAAWVEEHKTDLLKLGKGYHYGEWWGNGIQRGYGCPKGERHFSLFNIQKWGGVNSVDRPACCEVVPLLASGSLEGLDVRRIMDMLKEHGSYAVPFMNPEGIVIYHTASNRAFKKTFENDESGKDETKG